VNCFKESPREAGKWISRALLAYCLALLGFAHPRVYAESAKTSGYADFYWKWTPSATKTIMDNLGSTPSLTVCWDFGDNVSLTDGSGNTMEWGGIADLKSKAQEALGKTWTRYGKIDVNFIFSASPDPCDVSIHFTNVERPNVPELGKQGHDVYLNWTWMEFNRIRTGKFNSAFSPVWEKYPERLVPATLSKEEQIAWMIKNFLHEMGHVMGIAHEQDRRSIPMGIVTEDGVRRTLEGGYTGNVAVGPYDPLTLMNYNSPPYPKTDLTCGDVMTIRLLYGKRPAPGDPRDFCDIICSGSSALQKSSADDPTIIVPNSTQGQCVEPLVNPNDLSVPEYQTSSQQIVFPGTTVITNESREVPDPSPAPSDVPPPIGNSCQGVTWTNPPSNPDVALRMTQGDLLKVSFAAYVNPITRDWPAQKVIVQGFPTGTSYDMPAAEVYTTAGRFLTPGSQTISFDLKIPDQVCGYSAINRLPKCGPDGDYWLDLAWVQMLSTSDGGMAAINRCDLRKAVWVSKKKTKTVIIRDTTTIPARTETLTLTSMMDFKNATDEEPAAVKRGDVLPIRWYQKGTWNKVNVYAVLYRNKDNAVASANPFFRYKLATLTGKEGVNTATLAIPQGSAVGYIPGGANTEVMLYGWSRIELESSPLSKTALTKVVSPAFRIESVSTEEVQAYAEGDATRLVKIPGGSQAPYGFNRTFFIGRTEVTNMDYWRTMGKFPNLYVEGALNAANGMTYYDAILYCNARSLQENLPVVYSYSGQTFDTDGHCIGLVNLAMNNRTSGYRLPTNDEWIYAYYAGSNPQNDQLYYWGNSSEYNIAEKYAWYDQSSASLGLSRENPVGVKLPNAWGLHDMAGGVNEWMSQPTPTEVSVRGGSASSSLIFPQFGLNVWPLIISPQSYRSDTGFRICRTMPCLPPFLLLD
jgi:hypothetical protein